jgi:hypothetical protein
MDGFTASAESDLSHGGLSPGTIPERNSMKQCQAEFLEPCLTPFFYH